MWTLVWKLKGSIFFFAAESALLFDSFLWILILILAFGALKKVFILFIFCLPLKLLSLEEFLKIFGRIKFGFSVALFWTQCSFGKIEGPDWIRAAWVVFWPSAAILIGGTFWFGAKLFFLEFVYRCNAIGSLWDLCMLSYLMWLYVDIWFTV